jgi:hypothetical protein
MPDGDVAMCSRVGRLGFDRLQPGDFTQFRWQARGELRARLDMLGEPDLSDDAWVYRRGGIIRGIGALSQYMPWHWVLWSFPGELTMADWKRVIRFTRLRLESRFAIPGVMRISATARCDVPGAAELLERLGFGLEGVMQCYGPNGEAHWLYAITRRAEA